MTPTHKRSASAIRAVAYLEGFKGAIALLAATGLLALVHTDLLGLAVRLVEHAHLNPASRYPGIFLDAVSYFPNTRILLLAAGAALYSVIRLVEAYGLYYARAWAELLAAGSGAIYVPFELIELHSHPSWLSLSFLVANLGVVAIMVHALLQRRVGGKNAV